MFAGGIMSGNNGFAELVLELQGMALKQSAQAVAGLASELGTITENGGTLSVKLDRFQPEFLLEGCLFPEPFCDLDIELTLTVPEHDETGQIVLPAIPSPDPTNHPGTAAGTYDVTYKFDEWSFDTGGDEEQFIKVTGARVKQIPELKAGDRVLCALVNGGRDVVIISKVVAYE